MKMPGFSIATVAVAALLATAAPTEEQDTPDTGIDPEALIGQILAVDARQRAELRDLVVDAEYIEGTRREDGDLEEAKRFSKTVYIKFLSDTTLFHEEYLSYFEEGQLQDDEKLRKEARDQLEKKRKRKTRNIAYPMLTPFLPEHRDQYEVSYIGVADERIDGYVCHHFRVTARNGTSDHINGNYYFEAESFHLVRVDFAPAKLSKNVMFRLNRLNMTIRYGPSADGYWFPREFELQGKGKAAIFFGVNFAAVEYYRNPRVNTGIQAEIFEASNE